MTDEQIKQNAEAYADQFISRCFCGEWNDVVLNFTAGAKSRDEEIKSLQKQIVHLSQREQMLFDREVELIAENDQLCNPWISVKDRLPKEDPDDEGYSVEVIGLFADGSISKCFCSIEEGVWFIKGITCDKPTRWMPIPEV